MFFGVKVIHTCAVGENDRRIYEELILKVNADSFDEAYEKAENYMEGQTCEYTNLDGEMVRTASIEAVDCFLMYEEENDVQQVYSAFRVNNAGLDESVYYESITQRCEPEDYAAIRSA